MNRPDVFWKQLVPVLASIVVAAVPGAAPAGTLVFGNLGPSGTAVLSGSSVTVPTGDRLAVGFTIGGTSSVVLESVQLGIQFAEPHSVGLLLMSSVGTGTSARPSGTMLAGAGGPFIYPVPTPTLISFPFETVFGNQTPPTLSPGSYWFVFGSNDGDTNWVFSNDGATPTTQNSSVWTALSSFPKSSTAPYTSWTDSPSTSAVSINVFATPVAVPEPSTWVIAASGLTCAAWGAWRRRKRA